MPQAAVSSKVLYPKLSFDIMGAVYEVHKQLGPGFSEELYERALTLELATRQIPFEQQKTILKATGLRLGILINFGASKVQSERIVN